MNKTPPLHRHTHCQTAPANTQAKTWQRVCLSNRTTKTTNKTTDEIQHRSDNTVLPKWRVKCLCETFVQGSTAVILMKFCAKNPPLRQYPKRWR